MTLLFFFFNFVLSYRLELPILYSFIEKLNKKIFNWKQLNELTRVIESRKLPTGLLEDWI